MCYDTYMDLDLTCLDPGVVIRTGPYNTTRHAPCNSLLFIHKHWLHNGISTMYDSAYSKCTTQPV